MREIILFLREQDAKRVYDQLKDLPTTVALAMTPSAEPADQAQVTAIVPDAAFNDAMDVIKNCKVSDKGVLLSTSLNSVQGQPADDLKERIGSAESDAIAWEEVLQTLESEARPSPTFMAFIALATIVAVSALVVGSVPLLIGAMVIPPALSALLTMPIALLKGRWRLVFMGLSSTLLTLAISVGVAIVTAWFLLAFGGVSDGVMRDEIVRERTQVGLYAAVVAIAAGIAGGLSVATNRSSQLVGVMIAAAIIPSAATVGLGIAQGDMGVANDASALLLLNLVLIVVGGFLAVLGARVVELVRWIRHGTPADRVKERR